MRPLLKPSRRRISSPRQANHLHRYSATSVLPVPCFAPTWSQEKAHPNSRSNNGVYRPRVRVNSAREDRVAVRTAAKADANSSRWYLSRRAMSRHFRRTKVMERQPGLLRLDARELHHLGPFLNVLGDELAELSGRTCKRRVAKVCKPRFHRGIGENGIDLLVELLDDIGRCIHWCGDTQPRARIVARQKIAQRWDVRQRRRARRRCHRQRAQLAGSDKFDRRSKGIEYNLDPAA